MFLHFFFRSVLNEIQAADTFNCTLNDVNVEI